MNEQEILHTFIALEGLAIGIGDPNSSDPMYAPISLLCAVLFQPISLRDWSKVVQKHEDIAKATKEVINACGGIIVLRPSKIHLPRILRGVKGIGEA